MYIVIEIQNGSTLAYEFNNRADAFEKFFQIAQYIPKSDLTVHTVTISDENGNYLFRPITKAIVNSAD